MRLVEPLDASDIDDEAFFTDPLDGDALLRYMHRAGATGSESPVDGTDASV